MRPFVTFSFFCSTFCNCASFEFWDTKHSTVHSSRTQHETSWLVALESPSWTPFAKKAHASESLLRRESVGIDQINPRSTLIGRAASASIVDGAIRHSRDAQVSLLETGIVDGAASRPPKALHVVVSATAGDTCAGRYELINDASRNGFPLWKRQGGNHWLFSGVSGHWIIGGNPERASDFSSDTGLFASKIKHQGRMPHKLAPTEWRCLRENGAGESDGVALTIVKHEKSRPHNLNDCKISRTWCDVLQESGMTSVEVSRFSVSKAGNEWLYMGSNTGVGFGDEAAFCNSTQLFCAGGNTNGYPVDQAVAVGAAIQRGSFRRNGTERTSERLGLTVGSGHESSGPREARSTLSLLSSAGALAAESTDKVSSKPRCKAVAGSSRISDSNLHFSSKRLRLIDIQPTRNLVVHAISFYCTVMSKISGVAGIYSAGRLLASTAKKDVFCRSDTWTRVSLSKPVFLLADTVYHIAHLHIKGVWYTGTGRGNLGVKTHGKHFSMKYAGSSLPHLLNISVLSTHGDGFSGALLLVALQCGPKQLDYEDVGGGCVSGQAYTKIGSTCNGWLGLSLAQCKSKCTLNAHASGCPHGLCKAIVYTAKNGTCHLLDNCQAAKGPIPIAGWDRSTRTLRKIWDSVPKVVGCFSEDAAHDLGKGPLKGGFDTRRCRDACIVVGTLYFALQAVNGEVGFCTCGDTYGRESQHVRAADERCGSPCEGEASLLPERRCGSAGYNAIYSVSEEPQYIGCFFDDDSHDLKDGPGVGQAASFDTRKCRFACSAYSFFALQLGRCFCGNSFGTRLIYSRRPDSECGETCRGEERLYPRRRCGHIQRNAIYRTSIEDGCWSINRFKSSCDPMKPYPAIAPTPNRSLTTSEVQTICDYLGTDCGGFIFFTVSAMRANSSGMTDEAFALLCRPDTFRVGNPNPKSGIGYIRSWKEECDVSLPSMAIDLDASEQKTTLKHKRLVDLASGIDFGDQTLTEYQRVRSWNLEAQSWSSLSKTVTFGTEYSMCFWIHWREKDDKPRMLIRGSSGEAPVAVQGGGRNLGLFTKDGIFIRAVQEVEMTASGRGCEQVAKNIGKFKTPEDCARAIGADLACGNGFQFSKAFQGSDGGLSSASYDCECCAIDRIDGGEKTDDFDLYSLRVFDVDVTRWNFICAVVLGGKPPSAQGATQYFLATPADSGPKWVGQTSYALQNITLASIGGEHEGPGKLAMVGAWHTAISQPQLQAVFADTKKPRLDSCDMPNEFCDALDAFELTNGGKHERIWPVAYVELGSSRRCSNDAYTVNPRTGCNGWSSLTAQQCEDMCTINAQAPNCPELKCIAFTLDFEVLGRETGRCHLFDACLEPYRYGNTVRFLKKVKPVLERCATWSLEPGKALQSQPSNDAVDVYGYNPARERFKTEDGCKALCNSRPDCAGYTYRASGQPEQRGTCFLVRKVPTVTLDDRTFMSAICQTAKETLAVSVWAHSGGSTMVGAGPPNATCDKSRFLCAGWESRDTYRLGQPQQQKQQQQQDEQEFQDQQKGAVVSSTFGRPFDQVFQAREAVRNGGVHPNVFLNHKIPRRRHNMSDPWAGRTPPAQPTFTVHATINEATPSRLMCSFDASICATFNQTTNEVMMKQCETSDSFLWWIEDDLQGKIKSKEKDGDETLCMTRKVRHAPEVIMAPCDSAEFPFWFILNGYIKNFDQPYHFEECLGYHAPSSRLFIYPCRETFWQEFFWEALSAERIGFRQARSDGGRRRYFPTSGSNGAFAIR